MRTPSSTLDSMALASLADLAEQLRDGPLQELLELQAEAAQLADRLSNNSAERIEDLEGLVRLSVSAMAQFHAFTRKFAAVLRELTDTQRGPH